MSLPVYLVEIAFATDPDVASPAYQDVTAKVLSLSVKRGRQRELDVVEPSTCELRLDNGDRRFDPAYTKSPYYPYVLPMRKLRVSATWSGTTYYLFTGYVERWPISWDGPKWGSVALSASDDLAALAQATITGTFPQEPSGARIARVLTAAGWATSTPAAGYWTLGTSQLGTTARLSYGIPTTVLDAGQKQVAAVTFADTDNQFALQHIQDVVAAERGMFFADGQGRLVFQDSRARYAATSEVTYAESTLGANRIPYQDLQPDFSVDKIVNEAKVTAATGVTSTASDGPSRQRYRRRTLPLNVPLATDADAMSRAALEVALRKDARLEFQQLTIKPPGDDNSWPHALGRELGDRVTVERAPDSTSPITPETIIRGCFTEQIEHRASGRDWETSYQLSPADGYDTFFKLGTAQLGSATTAVLAY